MYLVDQIGQPNVKRKKKLLCWLLDFHYLYKIPRFIMSPKLKNLNFLEVKEDF